MPVPRDFPTFYPEAATRYARRLLAGTKDQVGLLAEWSGLSLDGDVAAQLSFANLAATLLGNKINVQVLAASLDGLVGVLTPASIETWCWRIAGNYQRLLTERPLIPGLVPTAEIEAPMEFVYTGSGWSRGRDAKPGVIVVCRVIDGTCCPLRVRQWIPHKYCYVVARELGISPRRTPFGGQPAELFGMRFLGRLVPNGDGTVRWASCRVGQFKAHNQRLRKRRTEPCPAGITWPCRECAAGLDQCPASKPRACRMVTLVEKRCLVCDQPTSHDEVGCVRCQRRPRSGFNVNLPAAGINPFQQETTHVERPT